VEGGHYAGRATTQKIMCAGLWQPTVYKDAKAYYRDAMLAKGWGDHRGGRNCV